jgi:hypothetical protein
MLKGFLKYMPLKSRMCLYSKSKTCKVVTMEWIGGFKLTDNG